MSFTSSSRPMKRLAVFCDGTWVGRETEVEDAPPSNIRQLANMVGEVEYATDDKTAATVHRIRPHNKATQSSRPDITAGYQEGVGLNKTFLHYIWDGATASTISDECIAVYRFIVDNYDSDHEIWLFGFSRGAFTVRCVAGMINNCGIIRRLPEYTDTEVQRLCYEIFRTYRSNLPVDAPKSEECQRWKGLGDRVWQVKRPIRFMGIIDTVGALGIPRLNAGIGFDWSPFEFFDQTVSSVVQNVYHAPCLHDRLWIFQPCLVYPSEDDGDSKEKAVVKQRWFPGTHYDVGRMTFRFIRQSPTNWIEEALGWLPDQLSRTIYPNEVLSDAVLKWLVQGVRDVDGDSTNPLMPNTDQVIESLNSRLAESVMASSTALTSAARTGSGDIYGDVLAYAPGGVVLSATQRTSRSITGLLNKLVPRLGDNIQSFLGVKALIDILTATADRRIPGTQADVYPYMETETVIVQGKEVKFSIEELAGLNGKNERGMLRYPSQTLEAFQLWKRVFGQEKEAEQGHRNIVEPPPSTSEVDIYARDDSGRTLLNEAAPSSSENAHQRLLQNSVTGHDYGTIKELVSEIVAEHHVRFDSITWEWEIPSISAFDLKSEVVLMCTNPKTQDAGNRGYVRASTYYEHLKECKWVNFIMKILDAVATAKLDSAHGGLRIYADETPRISVTCSHAHLSVNFDNKEDCLAALDLVEALDWLCKSMRTPSSEDGHFVSSASYGLERIDNAQDSVDGQSRDSAILPHTFRPFVSLKTYSLPEIEHSCWLSLFNSCMVVESPLASHNGFGKGLETSFDLMVALAASEFCLKIKGTLVFLGYHTVLYPVAVNGNCAQFHLITNTYGQINPYTQDLENRLLTDDYSRFETMRCYVGWCEVAHINLGTKHLAASVRYTSGKDKPRSLETEGYTLQGQFGAAAPVSAITGLAKNFKYSCHRIRFTPTTNYRDLLQDTSQQSVVLYDSTQLRFWLVPKLSLLLHMSHVYTTRTAADPDCKIPFAEPHTDAVELIPALRSWGESDILEGSAGGQSVSEGAATKFLFRQLLFALSTRILDTAVATQKSGHKTLYGFEYMDIICNPDKGSCMKELKIKSKRTAWLDLVNAVGTVIVCSGLGEAISVAEGSTRKCMKCNEVPQQKDYFAATLPCLSRLVEQRGGDLKVGSNCSKIAENAVWRLEMNPFIPCTHDESSSETCWEKSGLLQRVDKLGFLGWRSKTGQLTPQPAQTIPIKGAVVFG